MDLDKELDKCETMEDLTGKNGLIQKLIGGMVEKMLEKEMEEHQSWVGARCANDLKSTST